MADTTNNSELTRLESENKEKSKAITARQSQLCIIDMQGRLVEVMYKSQDLISSVGKILRIADLLSVPVCVVEHCADKLGPTVRQIVTEQSHHPRMAKASFSIAAAPDFNQHFCLDKRPTIIVAGIEAHVCVYQSVRDLVSLGFEVVVLADGVASRQVTDKDAALDIMREMGAIIQTVEMIAFDWIGEPQHPQFNAFIKLIK